MKKRRPGSRLPAEHDLIVISSATPVPFLKRILHSSQRSGKGKVLVTFSAFDRGLAALGLWTKTSQTMEFGDPGARRYTQGVYQELLCLFSSPP